MIDQDFIVFGTPKFVLNYSFGRYYYLALRGGSLAKTARNLY